MLSSVLVCSGGSGAAPVSEAAVLARYTVGERGFTGTVRLVRAADCRPGEAWPIKPFFALYGCETWPTAGAT